MRVLGSDPRGSHGVELAVVVIAVWIHTSALRLGIEAAMSGEHMIVASRLDLVVRCGSVVADSRASLVALADLAILVVAVSSVSICACGTDLGILLSIAVLLLGLALSEEALVAGAGGVIVVRAWAVAFLLLVVLPDEKLHDGSYEEEDGTADSNGESSLVHTASLAVVDAVGEGLALATTKAVRAIAIRCSVDVAVAERSVDEARAGFSTAAGHDGNAGECTHEKDVENEADERQKCASQAAGEENSDRGVKNTGT